MSRKVVQRTIDGVELRCTQFESMDALGLVPRVAVFGAHVMRRAAQKGVSGDANMSALLPVVFDVAVGLTKEEIQELARDLLPQTEAKVDGQWIRLIGDKAINSAFENLPTLFRALMFAVEVSFLGFFDAAQPGNSDPGSAAPEGTPAA